MDNLRLAVLIDGDNAPRDCLKSIMEEIAIYGTPMIKRIYGDWASHGLSTWKNTLLENAVTPKQQFAYTTGKNAQGLRPGLRQVHPRRGHTRQVQEDREARREEGPGEENRLQDA